AGALADAGGAATGPGTPTLERGALVGVAGGDVERLGILVVVVGGVGHRRGERLADDVGDRPLGELQDLVGVLDVLAADEVEDLTGLVGRDPHVADLGTSPRPLVGLVDRGALPRFADGSQLGTGL